MTIRGLATCPDEVKEILAQELKHLGAKAIQLRYRTVFFEADRATFYALHLKLRTASRLFQIIKDFPAHDWKMLYDQARRIKWPDLMDPHMTFIVEGIQTGRGEGHMSSNHISKRIREALQSTFTRANLPIPKVDLKDPKIIIHAYLEKGRCTVSFDTSGKTLHKRGYKLDSHPAPLKETLAASILYLLGYNGTQVLYDPMCGSGSFVIEGSMIALNKAPLIHRGKGEFGFEWIKGFDKNIWKKTQEDVRLERKDDVQKAIIASDIKEDFVHMAQNNALRARVERYITFSCHDFFKEKAPASTGLLVANLPYGERLSKSDNHAKFVDFYKKIGDHLKRNFCGWKAGLLVAKDTPYKFIGLKPKRKIDLMNGSIPVKLLVFEIY